MAVGVQRASCKWGPGLSGATARKALLSETNVASPPEAGPHGPTRLAGAQLPWYLALLASDLGLAALSESSLSLTSWRIKTSDSEARTPALVPVDQEVTLAVTNEGTDLGLGGWGGVGPLLCVVHI